jgi:hypothetical protein
MPVVVPHMVVGHLRGITIQSCRINREPLGAHLIGPIEECYLIMKIKIFRDLLRNVARVFVCAIDFNLEGFVCSLIQKQ